MEKTYGFRDKDEIIEFLNDNRNVEFINLLSPDILSDPRGFRVPSSELKAAFEEGKGFDGSSVEGLARIEESDVVAMPDPTSFRILPWKYEDDEEKFRAGLIFCDILNPDGSPHEGDTRYVLKRTLERAKEMGYDSLMVGPELEFFYFPDDKTPKPSDMGGYFSMGGDDPFAEVKMKTIRNLKKMGIKAEFEHHEVAKSQHEIDLKYNNALEMADVCMLLKYVVKETAKKAGIYATFMPKPITTENGSGMHVHQSLWKGEKNVFFDENGGYYLSEDARRYMAGVFHHINDITSVTNQWVNSYKRLVPGFEAPVYHVWGQKNRSALIRVPEYQPSKEHATRIEVRNPDPACNPYLAFSVMLAAGLDGIKNGYELQPPYEDNAYENNKDLKTLPRSLREALELTKKSDLVRTTLGDHIYDKFIENKEKQIEKFEYEFLTKVTPYEIEHNLPRL